MNLGLMVIFLIIFILRSFWSLFELIYLVFNLLKQIKTKQSHLP